MTYVEARVAVLENLLRELQPALEARVAACQQDRRTYCPRCPVRVGCKLIERTLRVRGVLADPLALLDHDAPPR